MAAGDQKRWDERYMARATHPEPRCPDHFASFGELLCSASSAVELACGAGEFSVWLAQSGIHVLAFDVSQVATEQARKLARSHQVSDHCEFSVADLDYGLPFDRHVDLIVCNMFRDSTIDDAIINALAPGGILAMAALSEVGASPGRFRAAAGELHRAFECLEIVEHNEADGVAVLVARKESAKGASESGVST